jgi:DNA-binding response OmpR family regulator
VIDDERRILNFVSRGLRDEGYVVEEAADGRVGLGMALSHRYDLVILDLLMPGMDGTQVLRRLLQHRPDQAVVVLSCITDPASKVRALELGAEDYVSKPFSIEELFARVRARLRTAARTAAGRLSAGPFALDMVRHTVESPAGTVSLPDREFLLLEALMRNAGRVVSKERLLSTVWGYHFDPRSNVVDVYVRRLRAKLGSDAIGTFRGKGYRLETG